jgi:hypothetical protein
VSVFKECGLYLCKLDIESRRDCPFATHSCGLCALIKSLFSFLLHAQIKRTGATHPVKPLENIFEHIANSLARKCAEGDVRAADESRGQLSNGVAPSHCAGFT